MINRNEYYLFNENEIRNLINEGIKISKLLNKYKEDLSNNMQYINDEIKIRIKNSKYLDIQTLDLLKYIIYDRNNINDLFSKIYDTCQKVINNYIRFYQELNMKYNDVLKMIKNDNYITRKPPPSEILNINWPSKIILDTKDLYEVNNYDYNKYKNINDIEDDNKYMIKEINELRKILYNIFDELKKDNKLMEIDGYMNPLKQYIFNIPESGKWDLYSLKKIFFVLKYEYRNNNKILMLKIYYKKNDGNILLLDEFEPRNDKYYIYDAILEPIYINLTLKKFRIKKNNL